MDKEHAQTDEMNETGLADMRSDFDALRLKVAELAGDVETLKAAAASKGSRRSRPQLSRDTCVRTLDWLFSSAGATCTNRARAEVIAALTGFAPPQIINALSRFNREIEAMKEASLTGEDAGPGPDRFVHQTNNESAALFRKLGLNGEAVNLDRSVL